MDLGDFVNQVGEFASSSPREKIQLFAWFLHTHGGKETSSNADIRDCFSRLHMTDPNVAKYLPRMIEYGDLIKIREGYKLERSVRSVLDIKHGVHHSIVQVSKLLTDLPGKVSDLAEKTFLNEAIKCYRIEAYRACIVMTWNLAYSHLVQWVLNDSQRLSDFNSAIARRYPKKNLVQVVRYEDFGEELKESEVIEICGTAGILNSNIRRILREKLGKRNTAAHPSSVIVVQSQADDVVTDLVNNVVLTLT